MAQEPYITKRTLKQLLNSSDPIDIHAWIRNPEVLGAVEALLDKEGEQLTNHKNDRGGLTKWGLTEALARELGYEGAMAHITKEKAALVAVYRFYYRPRFNIVSDIAGQQFAFELFEAGYLLGSGGVVKLMQRFLNVMNRQQEDWNDIGVDGVVGLGETVPALRAAVKRRGPNLLIKNLRGALYHHFLTLAEKDPRQEDFFNGWVDHRIGT